MLRRIVSQNFHTESQSDFQILQIYVNFTRRTYSHRSCRLYTTFPGSQSLAAARALQRVPQSVTICDRNLTRGRSSALTLGSLTLLTSPTGIRKIFTCARCCRAIPERTRAVRPFRSSVHSCQSSLLRHQNGDQNHMTCYPLHVDALTVHSIDEH